MLAKLFGDRAWEAFDCGENLAALGGDLGAAELLGEADVRFGVLGRPTKSDRF